MAIQWLHITLSLVLYISTAGISVHSHYCKNELKDINFWMQAKPCHPVKIQCAHHPTGDDENEKDCCDNKVSFEKVDMDLISKSMDQLPDWDFMAVFIPIINKVKFPIKGSIIGMEYYRPPPDQVPLHIRYQSFLC